MQPASGHSIARVVIAQCRMRQWQRWVAGHDGVNAGRDSHFRSRGNAAGTFAAEHALV